MSWAGAEVDKEYSSADTLIRDLHNAMLNRPSFMYRGISQNDQMYPSIMRTWDGNATVSLADVEMELLTDFRKQGASFLTSQSNTADFLACAQHYGIPTRLIDWTSNPFVALYFAIYNEIEDDRECPYEILFCDRENQLCSPYLLLGTTLGDMNKASVIPWDNVRDYLIFLRTLGKPEDLKELCKIVGIACPNAPEKCFYVLDPNYSNTRLFAQSGLFVIPKEITVSAINAEYQAAGVQKMKIHKNIRDELLGMLGRIGYNKARLFFDLQNIAEHVKALNVSKVSKNQE
jgi:hypothetical protein